MQDVPKLPRHLGLEDIKWLVGVQIAISLVVIEEIVVGVLVPLEQKDSVFLRGEMHQGSHTLFLPSHVQKRTRKTTEGS